MNQGDKFNLAPAQVQTPIQVGLSWDFFGGEKIDIDATVVLLNDFGAT